MYIIISISYEKDLFLYRLGLILFLLSLISGKAEHQYEKTQQLQNYRYEQFSSLRKQNQTKTRQKQICVGHSPLFCINLLEKNGKERTFFI